MTGEGAIQYATMALQLLRGFETRFGGAAQENRWLCPEVRVAFMLDEQLVELSLKKVSLAAPLLKDAK